VGLHEWSAHSFTVSCLTSNLYQSDPEMIKKIVDAVTIPVMAKVRIGHFVEAQVNCLVQRPIKFSSALTSLDLDSPSYWN
jgi:pyridoxal biosynthesis lyase PdxS